MRIVIVGAGEVSEILVKNITSKEDEIFILDENEKYINKITNTFSVNGIVGNSINVNVLKKIGIDYCDLLIAVSNNDIKNMMTCYLAKTMGCRYTIARVKDYDLVNDLDFYKENCKIDMILNPDNDLANEILEKIYFSASSNILSIDSFAENRVKILEIEVDENSVLKDVVVKDIKSIFDSNVLIATIIRKNKAYIPNGDFIINVGDKLSLISSQEELAKCLKNLNLTQQPPKSVLIIGGSKISLYLAEKLIKRKIQTKIVEIDKNKCLMLQQELPDVEVIWGSGSDSKLLIEDAKISKMDTVICLTQSDEINITASMFAKINNVKNIVSFISKYDEMGDMLRQIKLANTVSMNNVTLNQVIRCIKNIEGLTNNKEGLNSTTSIKSYHKFAKNSVEALEFLVDESCNKIGIELMDKNFKLKSGILIGSIVRNGEVILPQGTTKLENGDSVVIFTTPNIRKSSSITKLSDIFKS